MKNKQYILLDNDSVALLDELSPDLHDSLSLKQIAKIDDTLYFSASLSAKNKSHLDEQIFLPKRQFLASTADSCLKAMVIRALQLRYWDARHKFCAVCSSVLENVDGKNEKYCSSCDEQFYPIITPAIIVLIKKEDEILLARSPHFPEGVYGLIAGFLEPGESLRECVKREVDEEVGLQITNIQYFGSQSWPFPSTVMIGFIADYAGGEIVLNDGEVEIAKWCKNDEIPEMPYSESLAHQMIQAHVK